MFAKKMFWRCLLVWTGLTLTLSCGVYHQEILQDEALQRARQNSISSQQSLEEHWSPEPDYQPDTLEALSLEELLAVRVEGEYKGAGIYQSPYNPVSQQSINIAVLMPLGNFPRYSASLFAAADVAATQINQAGGINGRPVAIIRADINHSRNAAVQFARKLIEEYRVAALIGPGTTEEVRAVMEEVSIPLAKPLISISASSNVLNHLAPNQLFWRLTASNHQQAEQMVAFLKRENKHRKIALISGKGIYGQELSHSIRQLLPDSQFIEFSYSSLVNLDKLDLRSDLMAIQNFQPDAIIFSIHSYIIESYLARLELFWHQPLPTLIAGDVLVKASADRIKPYPRIASCLNIIVSGGEVPKALNQSLQQAFKYDAFGAAASYTYDSIILFALALESHQLSGISLRQAMQQITLGEHEFNGLEYQQAKPEHPPGEPVKYLGASGPVQFDHHGNNRFAQVKIEKYWGSTKENCR
jgi:hypothetical protein